MLNNPQYSNCPRCGMLCSGHTDETRQRAISIGKDAPCDWTPEQCRAAAAGEDPDKD